MKMMFERYNSADITVHDILTCTYMQRDTPLLRGLQPAVPTQVVLTTLSTLIHSSSLTTMEVNLHCHSRITSRWTHQVSCFVQTSKTTQKCLRSKIPKAARLDCCGVAVRIVCVCVGWRCVSATPCMVTLQTWESVFSSRVFALDISAVMQLRYMTICFH